MTTERWEEIERLYHAARDREPSERDRFLRDACEDEELRREVESLLRSDAEAGTFLEAPALEVTAQALAEGRIRSMTGRALGHYRIIDFVGAGGMGEVYRAHDARLARDVAVKVLPAGLARDPERLRRFGQEALATSSLNHPNILTIYDVGVTDSAPYVVYELLEGETLRDRLRKGGLSRRKAIEYAQQIAMGLSAAHHKGITHRDLKPENIFVTRDGRVKILDFGLAKLAPSQDGGDTDLAGRGEAMSIPGTPGYIAPEQLRGEPGDHRSDLFNLGAVLYEMLTGQRCKPAAVNEEPVEIADGGRHLDAGLSRVLRRCLENNPDERFQSALDLAFHLEGLLPADAPAPTVERRWRRMGFAAFAGVVLLAVFFGGRRVERTQPAAQPEFRRLTYRAGVITAAKFAPDGQNVIYSAAWDGRPVELFSTRLGSPESRSMGITSAGILGISAGGELALALGCELNWAECRGTLARMPLAGGAPREVLQGVFYADWSPDGKELAVVRAVDGRFRLEYPIGKPLYETDGWITYPRFSPKGDRIAFLDHPTMGENNGSVAVVDLAGRKTTISEKWRNLKGLAWSPGGDEVWFSANRTTRSQLIYAVTLAGKERLVLQAPGWMRLQEISRDGRVLALGSNPRTRVVWQGAATPGERDLSWFDWSTAVDLSHDGRKVLFYEWGEGVGGNPTAYLRAVDGGDPIRLGYGKAMALSPDGKWALALQPGPPPRLVLLPTGVGQDQSLPASGLTDYYAAAWFPDGSRILLFAAGADGAPRSYVQNVETGEVRALTGVNAPTTLVSPDGKLVAGVDEAGGFTLGAVEGGEARQIRGVLPGDELLQWSSDGRFVYVRSPAESVIEVFRVNLRTGQRELWKRIQPSDPVGFIGFQPAAVRLTPDGKSVVYTYWKVLTELYVVDGLH